jgi:hypothetical protein
MFEQNTRLIALFLYFVQFISKYYYSSKIIGCYEVFNMKKRKIIVCINLLILLTLIASLSGCISGISGKQIYEYSEVEYEADENTILEVKNINGLVDITGWEEDTIFLSIEKSTKKIFGEDEFEKVDVKVNEIGNKISIETIYQDNIARIRVPVCLDIKVPMFVTVESVQILNGGIYLSNIKGDVQIDLKNGEIEVCGVDGYVNAYTANGAITIKDTTGVKNINTLNGAVEVEIHDFKEDIEISTVNGVMDIFLNPELNANLEIEAKSIAGGISLNDLESLLDIITQNERYIEAKLGEGGYKIYMSITAGFIELYKLEH